MTKVSGLTVKLIFNPHYRDGSEISSQRPPLRVSCYLLGSRRRDLGPENDSSLSGLHRSSRQLNNDLDTSRCAPLAHSPAAQDARACICTHQ
jgi:hypothetical protein